MSKHVVERRQKTLAVRLSAKEREMVEGYARGMGVSASALMRLALYRLKDWIEETKKACGIK